MRTLRVLPLLFLAAAAAPSLAAESAYPARPIRVIVGFPPAGSADIFARLMGQKLSESFAHPVVIENRPGAATSIAAERVAKAPADGYTLLLIPISTAVQAGARNNLPYNLKRDIAPISQIEEAADEETYNLVVADWHNYFVGARRVLVHDNAPQQPTIRRLPGLR